MECTGLPALNGDNANTNKWHASAGSIALGWIIQNIAGTFYFICTTAGTGGTGSEPTWNTTAGATTVDGSVTWTCIGAVSSFTATWKAPHARLGRPLDNSGNWQPNAGMTIFIGDDHNETTNAQVNPSFNVSVLCVDHTAAMPFGSGNLKTTATINQTSGSVTCGNNGNTAVFYVYGLQWVMTGGNATFGGGGRCSYDHCTFSINAGGSFFFGDSSSMSLMDLKDCTFSITSMTTNLIFKCVGGNVKVENGTFTATVTTTGLPLWGSLGPGSGAGVMTFEGCTFTGVPNTQYLVGAVGVNAAVGVWTFKDCVVSTGMPVVVGSPSTNHFPSGDFLQIDLNRVDSGTAVYRNERYRFDGVQTTSTAVVRTGGASDGTTPISHQITTTANAESVARRFGAIPLTIWNSVTGANRNVTLYGIVNDSRLPNNDEAWFDCEYLGSSSTPQGSYIRGSKSSVLATGSALPADTSAWDSAATARANSTVYNVGDIIKTANSPGRIFFCVTSTGAKTSASSEPVGYATAVDGGLVTDGNCTFRAGCRFSQTLVLTSPQPQQPGYLYCMPKFGRPSMTYFIDPRIVLS
jgi:hypothetical protein